MFRFILYSLIFYFLLKAVGIVFRYFSNLSSKEKPEVEVKPNHVPYKVDKKDIVEAEFEDITEKEDK
ncbi:MAG: hypothetical protein KKF62_06555 [Bacteroidetes bacterium]|nr:hypothetical protein [Bacteroidota bacterium]MBU1113923.1 hypothetical protein [Bacteroidota bacterium]MBU1798242.1 hypothetical protein [Bacteroidota bacterium]